MNALLRAAVAPQGDYGIWVAADVHPRSDPAVFKGRLKIAVQQQGVLSQEIDPVIAQKSADQRLPPILENFRLAAVYVGRRRFHKYQVFYGNDRASPEYLI